MTAVNDIEAAADAEVLANYTEAHNATLTTKKAVYDFIAANEPFANLVADSNWTKHYYPALCKKGGMPTAEELDTACNETGEVRVCNARDILSNVTADQREEFNTKWGAAIESLLPFIKAGHAMDAQINSIVDDVFASGSEGRTSPIG